MIKKFTEMIKLVIHCSDIHIRAKMRFEEYTQQLQKFIERCRELSAPYQKEEVRIVIAGDLVHQKNTITPELMVFASAFIRQLEQIAKVIVIAGNHDLIVNNTDKKDTITSLFETAAFSNAFFLDYELDFQSGYVEDDNITWVVYSIYQDYFVPDLTKAKINKPKNKYIGLYHGMINGVKLDNTTVSDCGTSRDIFIDCDFIMAGDIHKRQEIIVDNGTKIVYPGSLIQQNFGETISNHGFAVWNIETGEVKYEDIKSDYNLISLRINNLDDIKNDKETLMNE